MLIVPVIPLFMSSCEVFPECKKSFLDSSVCEYANIRQVSNNIIELSNIDSKNSEFGIDNCNMYFDDATDNNQKLANFIESEAMQDEANLDSRSIKTLISLVRNSKEQFSKKPDIFFRDGEHPSLYWGLGNCRHLTLSVIDNSLLLSIVFPNSNIRKIYEAKTDNFLQIQQEINNYV